MEDGIQRTEAPYPGVDSRECSLEESGGFFHDLKRRAAARGIPTAAVLAMTYRCNFRCGHCYALGGCSPEREMGTDAWLALVDELVDAGCLFLLMTGGEALLHPGFEQVYRHAKRQGLLVSVFTNGAILEDRHFDLFRELPPRAVEMSLYGISSATFGAVTGTLHDPGRCLVAARRLKAQGTRLLLKTVVTKDNHSEFDAIREFADSLVVPFRYDVALMGAFDATRRPDLCRLPVRDAVALEGRDPRRMRRWRRAGARGPLVRGPGLLYRCSAGRSMVYVGPDGALYPCVAAAHRRVEYRPGSFRVAWRSLFQGMSTLMARPDSKCIRCELAPYCDACAAFCQISEGDENQASPYLCELSAERRRLSSDGFSL